MNELTTNTSFDLSLPSTNELSIYDASYPITLLSNEMKLTLKEAEDSINDVYQAVSKVAPEAAQIVEANKSGVKYVVDISEKMAEKIESGQLKLTTDKKGNTFAQLVGSNGRYSSKLPIKKEDLAAAIDPVQMAMAMQMKAMQEQLEAIAEQINLIDKNVKEVKQGQQNDRIGQYYSGLALFVESRNTENSEMRKALVAQSLKTISDAIFQLRLNLEADINYLTSGEYKDTKGKRVELIDERMNSINQGFAIIHQAEMAKAGIYCAERELGAMSIVLDEYSNFIKTKIAANAKYLAEWDKTDKKLVDGVWSRRAELKIDTTELRKQLSMKEKTLYLSMNEGN